MLSDQVDQDLKAALKAREALKVSVLRMLKAAASNAAIQKAKDHLEEPDLLQVVAKLIKQREESVEAFRKGGRTDLADKEAKEAEILRGYLPPALGAEELKGIVQAAIQEAGAGGPQAFGAVMKIVIPKVVGRADGKTVSQAVKEALG